MLLLAEECWKRIASAAEQAGQSCAIFRLAALKQADDSTDFCGRATVEFDLVRQGILLQGMFLAMMGLFLSRILKSSTREGSSMSDDIAGDQIRCLPGPPWYGQTESP